MVRHIYLCENSAEGIFSAIYRAYEEGYPHEHNEVVIDTEAEYGAFLRISHSCDKF